jgi:hypothetical protein
MILVASTFNDAWGSWLRYGLEGCLWLSVFSPKLYFEGFGLTPGIQQVARVIIF